MKSKISKEHVRARKMLKGTFILAIVFNLFMVGFNLVLYINEGCSGYLQATAAWFITIVWIYIAMQNTEQRHKYFDEYMEVLNRFLKHERQLLDEVFKKEDKID